jgi:uncharacterized protein involved in exopolysaccharide biosynthesis
VSTPSPTPTGELDLIDGWRVLRPRWRLVLGAPLAVGALALGVAFLVPPTFTATTTIVPPAQSSSSAALSALTGQLGALGGLASATGALKTSSDQYVSFLKSRNVLDRIIEKFSLKASYRDDLQQDAREDLLDNARFTPGKKDSLIVIEVDDHDPERAAAMANAFVDELRRVNAELAVGEASQRRLFFEGQLKTAKDALTSAEEELNASGVSPATMNTAPEAAVAAVARLKARITAQEVKIASLQGFVTEDNPELRQARLELAALRAQLAQSEEGNPEGTRSKYTEKYRTFKYQEMLFELIAKQYELARLDEAREGNLVQVLDAAVVPERKSKPHRALIAGLLAQATLTRRRSAA